MKLHQALFFFILARRAWLQLGKSCIQSIRLSSRFRKSLAGLNVVGHSENKWQQYVRCFLGLQFELHLFFYFGLYRLFFFLPFFWLLKQLVVPNKKKHRLSNPVNAVIHDNVIHSYLPESRCLVTDLCFQPGGKRHPAHCGGASAGAAVHIRLIRSREVYTL